MSEFKKTFASLFTAISSANGDSEEKTLGVYTALPGRAEDMEINPAGGMNFKVSEKTTFDRYVILGSPDGYYTSAQLNLQSFIQFIK